jgi:Protein of unknown function (DUF2384)
MGLRYKRLSFNRSLQLKKNYTILSIERTLPMSVVTKPSPAAEGAVLTKAAMRAAERLQISASMLASIIGLSEASISRMRAGRLTLEFGSKPFEIALLFVRLYRALDAIVGGDDSVSAKWLRAQNAALGGVPAQKIKSISGLVDVLAYLDARRALV